MPICFWPWMPAPGVWGNTESRKTSKSQLKKQNRKRSAMQKGNARVTGLEQRPMMTGVEQPSVENANGGGLAEAMQLALDENKRVNDIFIGSSRDVTLEMDAMRAVERFPIDGHGRVVWPKCHVNIQDIKDKINKFLVLDQVHAGGHAMTAWSARLTAAYPFMVGWQLDQMLLALVARVLHARQSGLAWADYIELYCGQGNLSRAAIMAGLKGMSFDISLSEQHDVLTPRGLRLILTALTVTKKGALLWHGTPCSSFTIMSRSGSKRAESNLWLGDTSLQFVNYGNSLAEVSGMTMFLASVFELHEFLEQPESSCLPLTPCVKATLKANGDALTKTYLGQFQGESVKPLQIWSRTSSPIAASLRRSKPCLGTQSSLVTRNEETGGFTGIKSELAKSQTYTMSFGKAVIAAFLQHRRC